MDRNEARIRIDELRETLRENSRRYSVERPKNRKGAK